MLTAFAESFQVQLSLPRNFKVLQAQFATSFTKKTTFRVQPDETGFNFEYT
jgi:hypothetical protein